jgi:PAS domain S-box-containing protein
MNIVRTALAVLTGVIILALAFHLAIASRKRGDRLHASFSAMCLSALLYLPFTLAIYSASSVPEYFRYTVPQMYGSALFLISLVWFAKEYTGAPLERFLLAYGPVIAAFEVLRTFSQDTLIFTAVRGLKTFILPWGEQVSILDASPTPWQYLYFFLIFLPYPVVLGAAWKKLRGRRDGRLAAFTAGIMVFLLANVHDMIVVALELHWVFLTEIAFVGLIAVMSLQLIDEVVRSSDTRNKLADTEIRFRSVFNAAYQFIALLDPRGRILEINRSALKTLKLDNVSMRGKYFWDSPWWANLPEEREKLRDVIVRAGRGNIIHSEIMAEEPGKDIRILGFSMTPVTGDDGTVIYLVPEGRDITDLRRAHDKIARQMQELQATMEELEATNEEFQAQNEELIRSEKELMESEEKFRGLVENINEAVFSVNAEGMLTYISPSIQRFGSFDPAGLTGTPFMDFIHPDDREMLIRRFMEIAGGNESPSDYRIMVPGGGFRWVQSSSRPIYRDGAFAGVSGILTDIHRRRIAEDKLLGEKLFIDAILDTLPGIFFMLDNEGNFIRWKGLGKQDTVFGYPTDEIWNMRAIDLLDEKDRHLFSEKMSEVLANGFAGMEVTLISKKGVKRDYQVSCTSIPRGGETYIIGVGIDITDRKRAEEERERTRMQLVQAQKMEAVGTLAGGIAHDFNNMLGGIMGSVNMIEIIIGKDGHPRKETILKYVSTAREASGRAADMTRQMLTLSRKSELKLAPVDITMSMKHVERLCASSFPKSVSLEFEIGEKPLRVLADPVQIEQVLLNLCVNASHAMTIMRAGGDRRGGTLTVRAEEINCNAHTCPAHPDVVPGPFVRIHVSDTGVGMDEDVRRSIFDPFFTTKEIGEGTGLGLAITYSIVNQHGGFIDVVSDPGRGSTFTVCLPALVNVTADDRIKPDGAGIVPGAGRILVIDDEATMLRVVEGMLDHFGYSVITAGNGGEAVDIYRRENGSVDGVLLDFSMPGASGLEVFEQLKEINGGVKALLCSGFIEGADLQKARDSGIRGFIQKPFTAEDLSAKIKELIG